MTIADLANDLGLAPEKVAVERNLVIVPRSTLADVLVEDGDELEIVHFVGGGDKSRHEYRQLDSGGPDLPLASDRRHRKV